MNSISYKFRTTVLSRIVQVPSTTPNATLSVHLPRFLFFSFVLYSNLYVRLLSSVSGEIRNHSSTLKSRSHHSSVVYKLRSITVLDRITPSIRTSDSSVGPKFGFKMVNDRHTGSDTLEPV